jgi:hypothetical protein
LGSTITNDASCARAIKSRIAMAKAAFIKKNILFTSKVDVHLWKKLAKWSIVLYSAGTWILRKVDQKYLGKF